MKRIIPLLAALLMGAGLLHAQQVVNMSLDDFYREFKKHQYDDNVGVTGTVNGSPYDREEFIPGEIVTTSRQRYTGIPLRLNIYSNEVEFRNEEGKNFNIGVPELIDYVMIGDEKYIYAPYSVANRIQKGYFMVLTEGNAILLQKKNVILKPAEPAGAYKDPVPARFSKTEDDFYLRVLPAEAKRIKNRKDVAEILGDSTPEMEQFIKENKTRFNKAEDLRKLMEFYQTLRQ